MSEQISHSQDPTSIVVVEPVTIERFEHETHRIDDMYRQLYESNPNLALFLRRRVAGIAPDLGDRESQSKLALELVTLIGRQQGIDGLASLWSLEVIDSTTPTKLNGPDTITPPAA